MSVFVISDLHLALQVEKPMDIFGGAWNDHVNRIQERWLDLIGPEDHVILPGDMSWGLKLEEAMADLNWIEALPGTKYMVKGNHDLWWTSLSKLTKLFETIHFIQNVSYEGPDFIVGGTRGWICPGSEGFTQADRKIYERELGRLKLSLEDMERKDPQHQKLRIGVLHFPPTNERLMDSEFMELFERYGVSKVVYGHLHGKDAYKNGFQGMKNHVEYILTSCDRLECTPLRIL
ncbi:MAG: metallophosphoesterase [Firmicutes bacterium]|nr:metallophosphoesterase [Bacillota bacterium]